MNVNMKKNLIISLTAAILLSISPLFQACSHEEVLIERAPNESLFLFQAEMDDFFSSIDQAIKTNAAGDKFSLKQLFKDVVTNKYTSQDALDNFDHQFKRLSKGFTPNSKSEYTDFQKLIFSFESYEEAVSVLNQKIEEGEGDEIQLQSYTVMVGILNLFNEHPKEFEEFFRTYEEGEKRAKKCGWWESWGECAAGIAGGVLEGIVGGCTSVGGTAAIVGALGGPFGTAKGAIVGCIGGGLVGAIYGGLNGATGNCDGCGE